MAVKVRIIKDGEQITLSRALKLYDDIPEPYVVSGKRNLSNPFYVAGKLTWLKMHGYIDDYDILSPLPDVILPKDRRNVDY